MSDQSPLSTSEPGRVQSPAVFLTDDEHAAVAEIAAVWNRLCKVVGDGPTRHDDLGEVVHHIHALQHFVMAQAAARAYPRLYRLAGGTLTGSTDV